MYTGLQKIYVISPSDFEVEKTYVQKSFQFQKWYLQLSLKNLPRNIKFFVCITLPCLFDSKSGSAF